MGNTKSLLSNIADLSTASIQRVAKVTLTTADVAYRLTVHEYDKWKRGRRQHRSGDRPLHHQRVFVCAVRIFIIIAAQTS